MARRLGLDNCYAWAGRAEDWDGEAHYSVSRATAPLTELWRWHQRVEISLDETLGDDAWPQGLLTLKGGDLREEIEALQASAPEAELGRQSLQLLLGRNGFFGEKELLAVRA
jgi:16S rRNA (guanine527-N7)-methyltransferase